MFPSWLPHYVSISQVSTRPYYYLSAAQDCTLPQPLPGSGLALAGQPSRALTKGITCFLQKVQATQGSDERISIAFNMRGRWDDTADLRAKVPLEEEGKEAKCQGEQGRGAPDCT